MLEHYSHIRIDAKRQALDALDELRKKDASDAETSDDDDRDLRADIGRCAYVTITSQFDVERVSASR